MALTTNREKAICARYSAVGKNDGLVHCCDCPLNYKNYGIDMPQMTCKAIMHYDRHKQEWVFDEEENQEVY